MIYNHRLSIYKLQGGFRLILSTEDEIELKKSMGELYYDNPVAFVSDMFPWLEKGALEDQSGPDTWQMGILEELKVCGNVDIALRIAVASGHGIGKTALVAWIILWYISTRSNPQIVVTASTGAQLTNKTWRELAKWQKLSLNGNWFEWTATKFYLKEEPQTWFASAIPWSEHNSEAFAGTHEENVLIIFDEASGIADIIWEVTEGAMTTPGAAWICFGNPTKNTGRFRQCFSTYRHRWITKRIDSRSAKMANKSQLDQWITDYGIDSDFIKVRVLGEFPSASSQQLIPYDLIAECQKYVACGYEHMPFILAVDVARFGDDQTVFTIRQGRKVLPQIKFRELDLMQIADKVIHFKKLYDPGMTIIDATGIGSGVVDRVRQLGYEVQELHGASKPYDDTLYLNLRAEMYYNLLEAMKNGIELPHDVTLQDDLIAIEYEFARQSEKLKLRSKDDMKKNGIASPDCADSLAMTYAYRLNESHDVRFRTQNKVIRAQGHYLLG
jgi:hypothetical protein